MKKLLVSFLAVFLMAGFSYAADDVDLQELKKQIQDLQQQVDMMSNFVNKSTRHTAQDKLNLSVELRTRLDSIQYKNLRRLNDFSSDMMQLWMSDSLINSSGSANSFDANNDMWNDAFTSTYMANFGSLMQKPEIVGMLVNMGAPNPQNNPQGYQQFAMTAFANMLADRSVTPQELGGITTAFNNIDPEKADSNNDVMFTNKLRLRLSSKINNNVSFNGRLTMYKAFGEATNIRFYNGNFNSMHLDGNSAAVPTDDSVHVERAYFVYKNRLGPVDWHFSFGRRPSTYGPPMGMHENAVQGGSPLAHIIQWNFDGGSLGFNYEKYYDTWDLASMLKFCYGQGFEGQWGTANPFNAQADVNDVNLFGIIAKLAVNGKYELWYNWAHAYGVTDGFTGLVAMPFTVHGTDYTLDGKYDEYTLEPNYSGYVSRFEPMSKIGDLDMHTVLFQAENFGFKWFVSGAMSKSNPDGRSSNAMFQFMGQDKMVDDTPGYSFWAGIMTPELPFTNGKLGVEYNHGSKYWTSMTAGEDALVGSKIATRGDVYEVYYHQPIVGNNFFATLGYMHYDYEYTNSGSPIGQPKKIEDATAFDTMVPVVDKVDQWYLQATYRY
ncbi:DUF3373 domain-containing protein [Flexistipes sp.]|uniref:DUF3373 domain-containing protein n=1 Tax=Flexistipes sp. TaxID=3088135 RepID=UPI002E1A0EAE|nr:DUF3373 domain-containing protein [Flexistipes sp.]